MVSDIKRFQRQLEDIKDDIQRGIDARARGAGRRYAWNAKRRIIDNDAVASTELFRGIGYQSIPQGANETTVRLKSSAPHSGYVEHGTGPSGDGRYGTEFPGVQPIYTWMLQKPTFRGEPTLATAAEIAGSIADEGTDAQPFFWDSVDDAFDTLVRGLRDDLHRNF